MPDARDGSSKRKYDQTLVTVLTTKSDRKRNLCVIQAFVSYLAGQDLDYMAVICAFWGALKNSTDTQTGINETWQS
jgi:hypothetical protein